MTAIERIKEIEKIREEVRGTPLVPTHLLHHVDYLLKAFKVMRDLAIEWGGEVIVEEFEKRMEGDK